MKSVIITFLLCGLMFGQRPSSGSLGGPAGDSPGTFPTGLGCTGTNGLGQIEGCIARTYTCTISAAGTQCNGAVIHDGPITSSTDSTPLVQAVINTIKSTGGTIYFSALPTGCYDFKTLSVAMTAALKSNYSNITYTGDQAACLGTDATLGDTVSLFYPDPAISVSFGTLTSSLYPTANSTAGATTVTTSTAANAGNFSPGDLILIVGNAPPASGILDAEINQVVSVNASTGVIGLLYPTAKSYSNDSVDPYGVLKATPYTVQNLQFVGLNINTPGIPITAEQTWGLKVLNSSLISSSATQGEVFQGNYNDHTVFDNVTANDNNSTAALQGLIQLEADVDMKFANLTWASTLEPVFSVSERSAQINVVNSNLSGSGQLNASNSVGITFTGNTINLNNPNGPCVAFGNSDTTDVTFTANVLGCASTGSSLVFGGPNTIIEGNKVTSKVGTTSATAAVVVSASTSNAGSQLRGNTIVLTNSSPGIGILIGTSGGHGMSVDGNWVIALGGTGTTGVDLADPGSTQSPSIEMSGNTVNGFSTGFLISNQSNEGNYTAFGNSAVNVTTAFNPSGLQQSPNITNFANGLTSAGNLTLTGSSIAIVPATQGYHVNGRAAFYSPGGGVVGLGNDNTSSTINRVDLGPDTSSAPALCPSGANLLLGQAGANCTTLVNLTIAGLNSGGTKPTVTGCGTIGTQTGGALAGTFVAGAVTSCTPVLTALPTSTYGYSCSVWDVTAATGVQYGNIDSGSATSATFPTIVIVSGDKMRFQCGVSY